MEQAVALAEEGVDGFFLETFSDLDEMAIAISAVREVSDKPIIACKSFIEDGETKRVNRVPAAANASMFGVAISCSP
jgi:methionine synthase I (cobalamin-dependent)